MHITGETISEGILERLFDLDVGQESVPGVIWSLVDHHSDGPLLLIGHGGGQHKKFPGITGAARNYVTSLGLTVAAIDLPGHGDRPRSEEDSKFLEELRSRLGDGQDVGEIVARQNQRLARIAVPEWQATLDGLQALQSERPLGPVGYLGLAMSCTIGVHLISVEPRIKAAVLGLIGLSAADQSLAQAAARLTTPIQFVVQWDDELVARDTSLALFDSFASGEKSLHANTGRHTEVPRFERESWSHFFARHLSLAGQSSTGS